MPLIGALLISVVVLDSDGWGMKRRWAEFNYYMLVLQWTAPPSPPPLPLPLPTMSACVFATSRTRLPARKADVGESERRAAGFAEPATA